MSGLAEPSLIAGAGQMLLGLLVVIGAIFGGMWLLRRLGSASPARGALQVLGGLSLGPRERILLIRYGAVKIVVGVAPGCISALHVSEHRVSQAGSGGPVLLRDVAASRQTGEEG